MATWPAVYFVLFAYRVAVALVMQPVILAYTTLGDLSRYAHSTRQAFSIGALWNSTAMTDTIGEILQRIFFGNDLLVAVGFQCIAFAGLLKLLQSVDPVLRRRLILVMIFPSFTIWTSVPSKEAVVVFAICLVLSYLVEQYQNRGWPSFLQLLGFYLLWLYKPHYLVAILFIVVVTALARHVRQKAFLTLFAGLVSLLPLYLFRDTFDALSFEVQTHFQEYSRSTRPNFFVSQYDLFDKMLPGMFQSLYGPTWSEANLSLLHMVVFLESGLLVSVLIFYIIRKLPQTPAYSFFMMLFATFWILFATYPLGIMNPGSAVRYRTGYFLLLFVIFIIFTSRKMYIASRGANSRRYQTATTTRRPTSI